RMTPAGTPSASPSRAPKALSPPPIREARPPARTTPATGAPGAVMMASQYRGGTGCPRAVDSGGEQRESRRLRMESSAAALDAAAECISRARYVVALTGAGLSVESGIPPFRGPGGLWTKHGEPPMDGYQRFLKDPRRAWEERLNPAGPMRELWEALAAARPNPGHTALAELEALGVLKCTITQNI